MVYLSFCPVLEAEVVVETMTYCFKEEQAAEAVVVAEQLLSTLTLKVLMIIIQAATYTYQLELVALAVKAGTGSPLEAMAKILLRSLKAALVRYYVRLHVVVAMAALATPEVLQPIQLVAQVALLRLQLTMPYIQPF